MTGALSLAAGVAEGKALEKVSGVQSVFVVNWPGSSPVTKAAESVAGGTAGAAAAGAAAGNIGKFGTYARAAAPWLGYGAAAGAAGFALGHYVVNPALDYVQKNTGIDLAIWPHTLVDKIVTATQGRAIKNEIEMRIHIDKDGNVVPIVKSDNVKTKVSRGNFMEAE